MNQKIKDSISFMVGIGFDINEIINIKNKDIHFKENKISINGKVIDNIPHHIFELIMMAYNQLSESPDDYILNKVSSDEHISMSLLRCYMFELNNDEDNDRKMLVKKVRMSGTFSRFYEWEQLNDKIDFNDIKLIKELSCMNLSKQKANILSEIYGYWKRYMFE